MGFELSSLFHRVVFTVMLIRWEERGMRARYGERFAEYCERVPQLFPRLSPAPGGTGTPLQTVLARKRAAV